MSVNDFIYILSIIGTIVLTFVALLYAKKRLQYIFFSLFTLVTGLWIGVQFAAEVFHKEPMTLLLIQASSALSVLLGTTFYLFSKTYIKSQIKKIKLYIIIILSLFFGLANFVPYLMIKEATASPTGINIIDASSLYFVQIFFIVCLLLRSIYLIYKNFRQSIHHYVRASNMLMIFGILQAVVLIGFVTTFLANIPESQIIVPISVFLMNLFIFIAMLKYQLFDIRYFAWRTIGYLLAIGIVITLVNILLTNSLLSIIDDNALKKSTYGIVILISTLAALIFLPIKNIIDKVTNKLFFRKQYSINDQLNILTTHATRTLDANKIQRYALKIINNCINAEFAFFIIFQKDGTSHRGAYAGNKKLVQNITMENYNYLSKLHISQQVIIEPSQNTKLAQLFNLNKIGSITKISTNNRVVGLLLLGEKNSGWPYTNRDQLLLSLVANELGLALENAQHYEEIQLFNTTLQEKVNSATKALKRTNAKLVALDDAKDEFISMASHQLRTPLTSVKGYISMLLEEDLGKLNNTQKQALKEAFDSSQRMVFLISDFLNVSRIRTGKFLIEASNMNMPEVIEQEIAQLRDMAAYKEQLISYNAPINFPAVQLDENKIRQVMMNMIDNAIYYTPKGGQIEIILEKTTEEIIFKVIDSGIGVPAKEQHRLFTKFFRAKNARQARPDGTGLGLFMAQKIITAQGGSIIFKSTENNGSTFGFRFPLEKVVVDEKVTQRV